MTVLSKINYQIIVHLLGLLFLVNGLFMLLTTGVSLYYADNQFAMLLLSGIVAMGIGGLLMIVTRNYRKEIKSREGYIIVTSGWISMALIGCLPYLFTGTIPRFTDAFFESMSGFTATGATILNDVEIMPRSILFWRSLTHWIGGMGIIVLAVAIFPLLGIGGMQLFKAEMTGPDNDKLHPRITDTAKRLWGIYVGFTLIQALLLKVSGMGLFDAVNHAMSTMSTGGFSTKNNSLAYWNDNPMIHYIVIVFMLIGSCNLILSYLAIKGRFRKIFRNEELKTYLWILAIFTILVSIIILFNTQFTLNDLTFDVVETSFRHSLFQVISIISTTGLLTADFTLWTPFLTLLFFGMMFLGGCAGSTSGGIKLMRHLIMIKNGILEFKRTLHPNAILPVRYNGKAVPQAIVFNILGFFIMYMLSFIAGSLVFSWIGLDFQSAIGGAAATLGNVGPALGSLGPSNTYALLPDVAKWWSSFLMLLGRLELFTVLILITPFFWRNR
ncbi:MAG: TrkH family potassium uptake protein [Bacteroidetes bacterium]|jgi:trk system potassium uptake protein TrkH|nr:TrkH family potassium uptake protein [Bacteroidota bacterium]